MSHYLPIEHWSPRYDEEFFTVKITGKEKLNIRPKLPGSLGGNANHPAMYYRIEVYCKSRKHICLRRYSQFKWLHQQLLTSARFDEKNTAAGTISQVDFSFPPAPCPWQIHSEDFLQIRLEDLQDYLRDALSQPGFAQRSAMKDFLELDNSTSE